MNATQNEYFLSKWNAKGLQRNKKITPNVQKLNVPHDDCTYNVVEVGNLSKCNTKQSIFSVKINTIQRNNHTKFSAA